MANQNQAAKKPKFSVAIQSDVYKKLINRTLGDPKKASRFITNISSAVAVNTALQECDIGTIVSGALLGESLNLSPSPQLGQYFLVPFNNKNKGTKDAQFVLGYKGYIQLALRSGNYKKLNIMEIKAGELIKWDPLSEEIEINMIEDDIVRSNTETTGYYAMFEYINGFKKAIYWSKAKMEAHANTYSSGYRSRKDYTFWEKDFDSMAKKTMLRQLISKWGIMSIEFQQAYEGDMGVIHEDHSIEYVDNTIDDVVVEQPEPIMHPMQEEVLLDTSEGQQVNLSDL